MLAPRPRSDDVIYHILCGVPWASFQFALTTVAKKVFHFELVVFYSVRYAIYSCSIAVDRFHFSFRLMRCW